VRLVDRVAVKIDFALHGPVSAAELLEDVGRESSPQKRLLGFLLLPDLPRSGRRLGAVLRCRQRIGFVGDPLSGDRRRPRHGVGRALARAQRLHIRERLS
jgi:hypothetical protein